MYMRSFVYRFVYVGVLSLGVALAAAFQQPVAHAATQTPSKQAAVVIPAPLPIVTLSTVHVHADAVRTPAAKPAAATRAGAAVSPDLVSSVATDHRGGASVSTLRLDMPYYSFGKMLPRVGKE
jgi:hypothetical protein